MVTATVGVVLILGFFVVRRQLLAGTDFLLQAEFTEIEPKLRTVPSNSEAISRAIQDHVTIDASFYFFQVHDERGKILFRSPNLGGKVLPDLSFAKPGCHSFAFNGSRLRVGEYYPGRLHVQIATRLDYLTDLTRRFEQDLAIALPAVLVFSALLSWWLGGLFLRPLRSIEQTARRISISNLRERIPTTGGKDEVARLCVLLNEMFNRLEKSFEQIKQFTADLSHELRTPLSIVALHTERLLNRFPENGDTRAELNEVLGETKRLNQIIDQLLVLAKAEAQSLPLRIQPHQAGLFVQEFAEDAAALAEGAGKQFLLRKNEALNACFDASWLRQVLFNLVSNSLKFADPGSAIHFDSFQSDSRWCLTITDRGPGIPPELRESMFERFKQLPQRSALPQGTGLGLAVSKSIVELHGGRIYLESADQPGLRVRIELPLDSVRQLS